MVGVNSFNGGTWILAIEVRKDAFVTSGRNIILDVAKNIDLPVIVVRHDSRPPNDTGVLTVVKDDLLPRARRMIGERLGELAEGFGIYELVKSRGSSISIV
jgi:hypothetical protein